MESVKKNNNIEPEKKRKKVLGWYFGIPLVWRILTALVLGSITGLVVGPSIAVLAPLGDLMLRLLKMIILPLIFFAIVMGVGSMPASKIGRVAGKILLYYFGTTLFAAGAGLVISNIFKPGRNLTFSGTAAVESATVNSPSIGSVILNMVPENVAASFTNGAYLQVLVFALFFGLAVSFLRDHKDSRISEAVITVYKFCEGGAEIMFAITNAVLQYTPIGIFALISIVFAEQGTKLITSAAMVIGLCYLGYAIQLFFVYGGFLTLNGLSFWKFMSRAKEATLMAFATRSSGATLPLTLRVSEEKLGIPRSIGGFTLPLGSQVNLDGEAYYQIIAVFTAAFAAGIHLSIAQQLVVIFVVTVGTMGTAGISGSGPVILLAVMNMVGLNVETGTVVGAVFALILGIDVILDMGRTAVNVTGDMVGTCIVAKSEGALDQDKWK
ncbi:MAG: cation:dicarboxylase symporter family transporter [Acidaminobacter sp.]|uniref:dicarboxylate/amino acid:cation symporter n=1 Tax=Acidaminobacter sp. TaxID=1872102 RepID=UPI00137FD669|nr:dicarboxylate/amino acid:cation symporter [Acidaminobacter sp.]MZQ99555.1 cation:dicarboxylase symporter family transporter [Acidaminobacter sp.]